MAGFHFKALDRDGRQVSGVLDASSDSQAYAILQDRGLAPINIKAVMASAKAAGRQLRGKALVRAVRQLATLLSAGVPLIDALDSLSKSQANAAVAAAADGVRKSLRAGGKFSSALEKEFDRLPPYVIRLAELGEATGQLGPTLVEAADLLEYEARAASEIKSALTYPIFLLTTGTVIVLGMFLFVVPRFAQLIDTTEANVPWISQVVIGFSLWLNANLFIAAAGLAVIIALVYSAVRGGEKGGASLLDSVPVLSGYRTSRDIASWARTLGGALKHGAELLVGLELAERGVRSARTRRGLAAARMAVRAGRSLDEALVEHVQTIDRMMIDMIRTGRSSGRLAHMLLHAAAVFEEERRDRTRRLTAIAEPMAIVVIAAVVGTIVLSIVLAMTSLYGAE
jgi:type II secretory pathway component PulF